MTLIKMNGSKMRSISLTTIFLFFLISCRSSKIYFVKGNYSYSNLLFNKNIDISTEFFGDMRIVDSTLINRNNIKKIIEDFPELKNKKIISYFETVAEPYYETILFYDELHTQKDTITRTEFIINTKNNNCIVYKKSKAKKAVYLLVKPKNIDNHDYSLDAQQLINFVSFNTEKLSKTTYGQVFFKINNYNNYLISRKILKTKLLTQNNQQKWEQYQFLTTINSFISNNSEYDSLVTNTNSKFQPKIDSLQQNIKFEIKDSVFEKIKKITKNEKVVMLNEFHWFPKHRMLAFDFLDLLKANNFNYLAIEAVETKQDSVINARQFPSIASGYYTREPYFAHFIRKAKSLGFKIVSYDDMNSKNRELTQAENIKKIIDNDSTAKVFVYAGVAHILENNPSHKWMAEYFKEITQINPLTFSQDKITGITNQEVVLLPSSTFKNYENLNTSVDYFIINNIKPTLEKVYSSKFKQFTLKNKLLKNKNLFIRIYIKNEYDLIRKNAIPIFITVLESKNSKIMLDLPEGSYFASIISDKNENIFDDYISIK